MGTMARMGGVVAKTDISRAVIRFKLASKAMDNRMRQVIQETLKLLQKTMKAAAPYATGLLRNNIDIKNPEGRDLTGFIFTGKAYHWHLLEYGTRNMSAQPFVRPSVIIVTPVHKANMVKAKAIVGAAVSRMGV